MTTTMHSTSVPSMKDTTSQEIPISESILQAKVKALIEVARLYMDGNISHADVETKVKQLLQSLENSANVVSFSRQLKRFEKTCNQHFCGFWTECKNGCQYKGSKAAWKHEVGDIYAPLEIRNVAAPSGTSPSLTQVWLEQLEKQRMVLDIAALNSVSSPDLSVIESEEEEKDFEMVILEERLARTQRELEEAKNELLKAQSLLNTPHIIPDYTAAPVTEAELKEIVRLQGLENSWLHMAGPEVPATEDEARVKYQAMETSWLSGAIPWTPSHERLDSVEIVVGGVPEHFNYPWHLALSRGMFAQAGLNVRFVEVPGGTGEMMRMLRAHEIDIAVALTEGIVANIVNDTSQPSDVAIIGTYVSSPLTWGISVDAKSPYTTVSDLYNSKIGISRFGSGSHLMSFLLAEQQGWKVKEQGATSDGVEFVVKSNIHKMVESLHDGSSDVFLWETFMTKPYYDSGELRKVGEIVTPWPCFLAASRREFIGKDALMSTRVSKVMEVVRAACNVFKTEKASSVAAISERHNLKPLDAAAWFSRVAYPHDAAISNKILQDTVEALKRLGLIKSAVNSADIIDNRVGVLSMEEFEDAPSSVSGSILATSELPKLASVQYGSSVTTEIPVSARSRARKEARSLALSLVKSHMAK